MLRRSTFAAWSIRTNAFRLLVAISLVGCAATNESPEEPSAARPVWPRPPAPARFRYEMTLRSSSDVIRLTEQQRFKALVTGGGDAIARMVKPYAIAAAEGIVYVSDTALRRVHAFDVARGRYFNFGYRREGKLTKPLGLAVDATRHIYVADAGRQRAVMFDHLGLFLRSFGDATTLTRPTDVAVTADGSTVYVVDIGGVDSDQHQVVAFDRDGAVRFRIRGRGSGPGELNLPVAAALGTNGQLFVLDAGNFRVQVFSKDGQFVRTWGSVGRGYGQFARPKGIAVDHDNRVYIADAAFGNVQIFDATGTLLLPIGRAGRRDQPGHYALLSDVGTDRLGFVYLLDQLFNKVEIIRHLAATQP